MQMKLIIARKVLHLASFWKWEFLELGNDQFAVCPLRIQYRDQMWLVSIQLKISVIRTCNFFILEIFSKIIIQYVYFFSFYQFKPFAFRGGLPYIFVGISFRVEGIRTAECLFLQVFFSHISTGLPICIRFFWTEIAASKVKIKNNERNDRNEILRYCWHIFLF